MKKILVPIDFSDTSLNGLSYAIQLFGSNSLEITILHIYGVRSTALIMKNIDDVLKNDAIRRVNSLFKEVQNQHPAILLKSRIVKDYAVSEISALGNSGEYDFVVMGTKGATGLKEVFLGSVAGGVISETSAPVLVVPNGHSFSKLHEIAFALSENLFLDAKVISPLRNLAAMHQSKIKVLHIAKEETTDIKKGISTIEDLNPSINYAIGTGNINRDLNDFLLKNNVDLLCMVRTKKGFIDQLFNNSVTLKQTFNSPVPLLILHDDTV